MTATPRERFISALERRPLEGLVPHFELVFFLTMEAFGRVHPRHRSYHQWDQMSERERGLHRAEIAGIHLETAERYGHSAIFLHPNPNSVEEMLNLARLVRERSGDRYFLLCHGDATFSVPSGASMADFCGRLADDPDGVRREAGEKVDEALARGELLGAEPGLIDGFALCSDYCFNAGPFLSPALFADFVAPFLARLVAGYRAMGFYVIKHCDGNIMPILDQMVQAGPHALHSLDPQAGVDLGTVKKLVGDKVCLIGNVNCGLLQTGTDGEVAASVRGALRAGMPGFGYIFSTSNCVYTGMPLARYEMMVDIWRREGVYGPAGG